MLAPVQSVDLGVSYLRSENPKGVKIIYGLFSPSLYGIILRRIRGRDLAEGILLKVFVRISSQISDYKENTSFFGWMLKLVREECKDYMIDESECNSRIKTDRDNPILDHIVNKGYSPGKTASLLCISKDDLSNRLRSELNVLRNRVLPGPAKI